MPVFCVKFDFIGHKGNQYFISRIYLTGLHVDVFYVSDGICFCFESIHTSFMAKRHQIYLTIDAPVYRFTVTIFCLAVPLKTI